MQKFLFKIFLIVICTVAASCSGSQARQTDDGATAYAERGAFSADSAFAYVAAQVEFGPRVPGTTAHDDCAAWLVEKLYGSGADTVTVVGEPVTAWNGTKLPVKNILARFGGKSEARPLLLVAHYDTRPWADEDPDPEARLKPFDGANDGASGVAVILEIARNLGLEAPEIPVDILLTDVEDYGSSGIDDSWCLGSVQFAQSLPYKPGMGPRWGILLDMVGGKDARFPKEYFSTLYASAPVAKIWDMAGRLGLRNRFPTSTGGAITDDHLPLIGAGIPVADIIETNSPATGSFPPTWHTRADNLDNIDRSALGDVGRVVLNVIYNEK